MVTGAMIGNFTQVAFTTGDTAALLAKFNTTNGAVSKGLPIKTNLQKMVATGYTARRIAVDTAKCESCHEQLGTAVEFHSGARNDPTACAICHNTSKSSGGWSANASTFVHGIHAGTITGSGGAGAAYSTGKRTIPFTWVRGADYNFPAVVYPGILKRCDNCHVPNAVNFGATGTTIQPNLLWSTSGTGKYTDDVAATYKVLPRNAAGVLQYVAAGVQYGNVFSYTPEGSVVPKITTSANANNSDALTIAGAGGVTIAADVATLVESPITSACFACHDSAVGQAHMVANGGTIYGPRAASLAKPVETCLICHGMGRDQDAAVVHAK
jgi:OmcA/MtrC family decaheme c-type cytochrome